MMRAVALIAVAALASPSHASAQPLRQAGIASFYDCCRATASGARFDPQALAAAHRTLPFGTMVRVTNQHSGRSVVVRINDRGPFIRGRIIDLTPAGARAIGMSGLASVVIEVVSRWASTKRKRRT